MCVVRQAAEMMATAAGPEIALDVREALAELRPKLTIVDYMLPAGIAAGESTGTPTASLVHFPYGLARTLMLRGGGAWTTDRAQLNSTRSGLGLEPATDDLAAWESAELLLVTVPKWFDLATDYPAHVVHAGPLGVTRAPQEGGTPVGRPLVLLGFSTTVMQGQVALIQRVCDALVGENVNAILTLGPAVSAEAIHVPPNIDTVAYADHDHLLPRCAAVVTHGGLGTTLRALAHGTPLLLLPLGRDQQFNAGRVAEFGAGICLPVESSPGEIASALVELLAQPQFRKAAADAATAIATDRPDEAAAEELIGLARLARSHSSAYAERSPYVPHHACAEVHRLDEPAPLASLSPEFAAQTTTASARIPPSSPFRQRRIPRSSRRRSPETPAGTRESPQGQARQDLLAA